MQGGNGCNVELGLSGFLQFFRLTSQWHLGVQIKRNPGNRKNPLNPGSVTRLIIHGQHVR
jgi:hypothetical protein